MIDEFLGLFHFPAVQFFNQNLVKSFVVSFSFSLNFFFEILKIHAVDFIIKVAAILAFANLSTTDSSGMALAIIFQTFGFLAIATTRVKLEFNCVDLFNFGDESRWVFVGNLVNELIPNVKEFVIVVTTHARTVFSTN